MSARARPKPAPKPPPPIPPGTEALLGRKQICAALGVCARKFDGMLAAGEYPPADTRIGANPRWRVETHNEWVRARCRKSEA